MLSLALHLWLHRLFLFFKYWCSHNLPMTKYRYSITAFCFWFCVRKLWSSLTEFSLQRLCSACALAVCVRGKHYWSVALSKQFWTKLVLLQWLPTGVPRHSKVQLKYPGQGCRELIRLFWIYHWKGIFEMSPNLRRNCLGSPLGAANYLSVLQGAASLKTLSTTALLHLVDLLNNIKWWRIFNSQVRLDKLAGP